MKLHVKEVAEAKGITSAKALSERAGIPYASVHRIWNGSVTMLALGTIERLCKALNVQPGMLMSWIDTESLTAVESPSGETTRSAGRRGSSSKASKRDTQRARTANIAVADA